jgi:hypothetical protein
MVRQTYHGKRATVLGEEKVSISGAANRENLSLPTDVIT